MQMTGAKILMECLLEQGVDTIFGYPGGTILNVYDELYSYGEQIRHVLTAHEQGACHAADGYARSTGKVGVCFATSGPGCTNLVTGIATAYMDSSPIVCITCNVTTDMIGKDTFQEVDITGVTMPITKCNYLVRRVEDLADTVREAFAIARSGRPGPVLIDIPKNVFTSDTASAPSASTARAMSAMSVTFGDNFTISVLSKAPRAALTTCAAPEHDVPKAIPPCLTLGHEMLSSIAWILSSGAKRSHTAT